MASLAQKSTIKIAGAEVSRTHTTHACAFFKSREEYYEVLLPFIKEGLTLGDKTLNVMEACYHEDHLNRLKKADVPTDQLMASGQFELKGWTDSYLIDAEFNQEAMLDMVETVLKDAKAQGYPFSRLVGTMEWACIQDVPGVNDMVKYEARLNHMVNTYDAVFVCCYDINKHGGAVLMDVLRTHPYVIIGRKLHANPYFVPPEEFLTELAKHEPTQKIAEA